jgi:hypothetical protein
MSFLKFLFDSDHAQRRDIEELSEMQYRLATTPTSSGASERWVGEIADEVKELAATVRVLMRMLAEAGALDVAKVRDAVTEELRPASKRDSQAGGPQERGFDVTCLKCSMSGWSNEMVKVGADWMCRPCARNP